MYAIVIAVAGFTILLIGQDTTAQWDFKVYYHAAAAYFQGLNPYDRNVVNEFSGGKVSLPFVYSPASLPLLYPLTNLDVAAATELWLILKVVLLVVLTILWIKYFLPDAYPPLFLFFCLFAYNAAVYVDLLTGNISIVEQLFLWMSFVAFAKQRPAWFILFVALASIFKLAFVAFYVLLFLEPKNRTYAITAALLIVGGILSMYLFDRSMFGEFLTSVKALAERGAERGAINPSALAAIKDAAAIIGAGTAFAYGTYAFLCILVWFVAFRLLILLRTNHADLFEFRILSVFMICFAFALTVPRMKTYSYILLLVPSFWIILRTESVKMWLPTILVAALASTQISQIPKFGALYNFGLDYFSFLFAGAMWVLLVRYMLRMMTGGSSTPRDFLQVIFRPLRIVYP